MSKVLACFLSDLRMSGNDQGHPSGETESISKVHKKTYHDNTTKTFFVHQRWPKNPMTWTYFFFQGGICLIALDYLFHVEFV